MENSYTTPSQAEMCCRRSAHTAALRSLVTPKWVCLVLLGAFTQKAAVLASFWAWFFNVPGAWVVCFVLELPFVTPLWIFQDSLPYINSPFVSPTYRAVFTTAALVADALIWSVGVCYVLIRNRQLLD